MGKLDATAAASLLAAAADLALVLDEKGVILDIALGSDDLTEEGCEEWIDRNWIDTVTVESRPKIEALLRGSTGKPGPRWRHVNHPSPRGPDIPILYSTVALAGPGRIIAVGRDLRPMASLQQQLVDAQQSMEREYSRLRHAETRYRLLFQIASEAVLIVDAVTRKIIEANPAAGQLLGQGTRRLVGRAFPEGFDEEGTRVLGALLTSAQNKGRAGDARVSLVESGREFLVSASLFRQDDASSFLLRLAPVQADSQLAAQKSQTTLIEVLESSPDGLVVTSLDGRILTANRAFLDMAQLASEDQAVGEFLDRWLGRPGVDLSVLVANMREHGSVRLFATMVRGEFGTRSDVEISGVAVLDGASPCLGFAIRGVGHTRSKAARSKNQLPRSVEQLTELVGRVPLKDLVGETTDVIERLCIEAALELTGDNRASAAEMLGLSRQSLYVKLRRYGLGDLDVETESH